VKERRLKAVDEALALPRVMKQGGVVGTMGREAPLGPPVGVKGWKGDEVAPPVPSLVERARSPARAPISTFDAFLVKHGQSDADEALELPSPSNSDQADSHHK